MFGVNDNNHALPMFLDENRFQLNTNSSNHQLQHFGKFDPVNYFGNELNSSILRPNKRVREAENLSRQQKHQISLNYNLCQDEIDHRYNPVSTGLKLSYDDDEPNSSVTSASGSMAGTPSILMSLGDDIRSELGRQKEESDQYIKIQQEQLAKGFRDLKQRHMTSFLNSVEDDISKKLREKESELENMNRKNSELMERIKNVATEANNWHCRAKYNESMVNILKNKLQNTISQGVDEGKEGFGDSEVDDATSYIDPTNYLPVTGGQKKSLVGPNYSEHLTCRACQFRQVSILLMPCRHLCVCKECYGFVSVCPVCRIQKSASVEVYLS